MDAVSAGLEVLRAGSGATGWGLAAAGGRGVAMVAEPATDVLGGVDVRDAEAIGGTGGVATRADVGVTEDPSGMGEARAGAAN